MASRFSRRTSCGLRCDVHENPAIARPISPKTLGVCLTPSLYVGSSRPELLESQWNPLENKRKTKRTNSWRASLQLYGDEEGDSSKTHSGTSKFQTHPQSYGRETAGNQAEKAGHSGSPPRAQERQVDSQRKRRGPSEGLLRSEGRRHWGRKTPGESGECHAKDSRRCHRSQAPEKKIAVATNFVSSHNIVNVRPLHSKPPHLARSAGIGN